MFNYQSCTVEELVVHVKNHSRAAITQAKKYYLARENSEVVAKIDKARQIVRRDNAIAKVDRLTEEIAE